MSKPIIGIFADYRYSHIVGYIQRHAINEKEADMKQKKLSVIIPVYNTEKWLSKCIDSVLWQSYRNVEVICVDDASPDQSAQILADYAKKDERVIVIKHEKNRGLFRARVTGMMRATGDYIAFLDSDDFISCDWFRPLIEKIEDENAEMVIGNTVNVDETGKKTYYNYYRSFNRNKVSLCAPELMSAFFQQHGECFIWHTVWNKVYKKSLIDRALPYFEKMPEPLVMGEDIAFSSVFYTLAEKLAFSDNDCYFYFRHSEASTSNRLPAARVKKNLQDIIHVFEFVQNFLCEINEYDEFEKDFKAFKDKYYVIWSGNIKAAGLEEDREVMQLMAKGFGKSALLLPQKHEFYFYEQESEWDEGYEKLKEKILFSDYKYISFDIYDTLISRPFWEPTDLFRFVEDQLRPVYNFYGQFVKIRQLAEAKCRRIHKLSKMEEEDVTLREIYEQLVSDFAIPAPVAAAYEAKERELELQFCYARESGRDLYRLALCAGKKVVLVSDMYLEEEIVRKVLTKNGITEYEELFLSSKDKKLKAGGGLYRLVLAHLGIQASEIMHIGNNREVDIRCASELGIMTGFLPSAIDVFTNRVPEIYTGDAFKDIYCGNNNLYDSRPVIGQMPLRCLYAGIANHMFDYPFRKFNPRSTYNADPYYMGFMALGMHVFDVARWIYQTALQNGYESICFLARDGYVIKQVFDCISAWKELHGGKKIGSTYFCATRRSLYPCILKKPGDVLLIASIIDYRQQSPETILQWFSDCCKQLTTEIAEQYEQRGINLEKRFDTQEQLFHFLQCMAELSFDEEKSNAYRQSVAAAFKRQFEGRCAIFDIGYSGRLQEVICNLAGKSIDVFYIHDNGSETKTLARRAKFRSLCYYDFTPYITGIVRECLLSETGPSCVGYQVKGDELTNIYDTNISSYAENYAIKELHRGAVDFCKKMISLWGDYLIEEELRKSDVSAAFENLVLNATPIDFGAFSNTWLEDKMHSGYEKRNLAEILQWYSDNRLAQTAARTVYCEQPFRAKTKFGRAAFYFLFDRKTFWSKVKKRLRRKRG